MKFLACHRKASLLHKIQLIDVYNETGVSGKTAAKVKAMPSFLSDINTATACSG
jgi:hypothetical protein